jgi:hypothetical protein
MTAPYIEYEGRSYTSLEWQEFVAANLPKKLQSLIETTKHSIETTQSPEYKKQQEAFLQSLLAQVPAVEALAAQIGKEVEVLK